MNYSFLKKTLKTPGVTRPGGVGCGCGAVQIGWFGNRTDRQNPLLLDTRETYIGPLSENLSKRQARLTNMSHDGSGNVRLEYAIPTRELIGFRNAFLTLTAGNWRRRKSNPTTR